jgi:hypothetical protein
MWKCVGDRPQDEKTYLVSWRRADGTFSAPHRAYYVLYEDKFFSLENNNSHPIVADIYFEIPEFS